MGVQVGIAATGRAGEVIFNRVADLEVPAVVKNSMRKAVKATKQGAAVAGKATVKAVGSGVDLAKKAAKSELTKAGAELSQFGQIDLESHLKPDEKSAIVGFLRDTVRKKQGDTQMSDVPEIKGQSSYGASVSNGNLNAAMKFIGGGAYLPTDGSTGVYLYVDDTTNQISGFAATLKWTIGGK